MPIGTRLNIGVNFEKKFPRITVYEFTGDTIYAAITNHKNTPIAFYRIFPDGTVKIVSGDRGLPEMYAGKQLFAGFMYYNSLVDRPFDLLWFMTGLTDFKGYFILDQTIVLCFDNVNDYYVICDGLEYTVIDWTYDSMAVIKTFRVTQNGFHKIFSEEFMVHEEFVGVPFKQYIKTYLRGYMKIEGPQKKIDKKEFHLKTIKMMKIIRGLTDIIIKTID